jgi:hypothetical protein
MGRKTGYSIGYSEIGYQVETWRFGHFNDILELLALLPGA